MRPINPTSVPSVAFRENKSTPISNTSSGSLTSSSFGNEMPVRHTEIEYTSANVPVSASSASSTDFVDCTNGAYFSNYTA